MLQHAAADERHDECGEAPFADHAKADKDAEQNVISHAAPLDHAHERPKRRGDGASQHHRMRHALMQIPASLIEKERR
jgi:hypothetical protein